MGYLSDDIGQKSGSVVVDRLVTVKAI